MGLDASPSLGFCWGPSDYVARLGATSMAGARVSAAMRAWE
ncbi:Hypothetical protein A7982_09996 [Minicystis rosea]|nr:Hypothetical protein A7982_09996 [Minicystis rosea]